MTRVKSLLLIIFLSFEYAAYLDDPVIYLLANAALFHCVPPLDDSSLKPPPQECMVGTRIPVQISPRINVFLSSYTWPGYVAPLNRKYQTF